MSYPMDIDEYTDERLEYELDQRRRDRANGICDYCKRPPQTPPCRFEDRHTSESIRRSKCSMCGTTKGITPDSKYFVARPDQPYDDDWDGCERGAGT